MSQLLQLMKYVPLLMRYLPALLKGKSIADQYMEEHGEDKPLLISRRVVGIAAFVVFTILTVISLYFGISIPDETTRMAIDTVIQIITFAGSLYGVGLYIYGEIKKKTASTEAEETE